MADDIQALDSSPIMRIEVDYTDDITGRLTLFRDILQFRGTAIEIINHATIHPRVYELNFVFTNKEEKYNFLEFFHLVRGEFAKFWFIGEELAFELASVIAAVDTQLVVKANNFEQVYQGHERICIRLRNGDILTRAISAVIFDEPNDTYILQNNGVTWDRVIEIVDVLGIFFISPVRFDNQIAKIINQSNQGSTCVIPVFELLTEYPP